MEFLAKHGPLRQLDHYGRHLSFIQYYLIDVITFAALICVLFLTIGALSVRWILRKILVGKEKEE